MAQKDFDLGPFFDGHRPDHKPVELSVSEQDSVTYFAKKAFTITEFNVRKRRDDTPQAQQSSSPPAHPFNRPLPWEAYKGSGGLWRVSSGPAIAAAIGWRYDAIFEHGTSMAPAAVAAQGDPDVDIGP